MNKTIVVIIFTIAYFAVQKNIIHYIRQGMVLQLGDWTTC